MDKKRPAKIIIQQRKNFADAKAKLVDNVKGLASDENPEPMPANVASRFNDHLKSLLAADTTKEPRAKFGSFEGKVSTFLGIAPSQTENRNDALAQGLQDGTRHVPTYLAGAADKYPEGVAHISDGLMIKAKRPGGNNE